MTTKNIKTKQKNVDEAALKDLHGSKLVVKTGGTQFCGGCHILGYNIANSFSYVGNCERSFSKKL